MFRWLFLLVSATAVVFARLGAVSVWLRVFKAVTVVLLAVGGTLLLLVVSLWRLATKRRLPGAPAPLPVAGQP